MFHIDKTNNEALPIQKTSFKALGFGEREHLQEWIAKNPDMLGESLLIIQKEFSDFDDTCERLDLLALDKKGDLVIIENKLDDSGRDVTWQALKYVSYCASLTTDEIVRIYQKYIGIGRSAEAELCAFFELDDFSDLMLNRGDQRIFLVAAHFRKEVTSTVMWLIDHKIKIKCIKVTPYMHGDNILLDTEQIIPVTDAEEYVVKLAHKRQQDFLSSETRQTRHSIRLAFWEYLLPPLARKTALFAHTSPSTDNWVNSRSGHSGIYYTFIITDAYVKVQLWIGKYKQAQNKQIFDHLHASKVAIEAAFGAPLVWERLDAKKSSRIDWVLSDVSVSNENDWDKIARFLTDGIVRMENAFTRPLKAATQAAAI